jgi:S-adenosylmethionine-diacylglycerol 3-amino-3-carboxypropyl transferase
MLCVTGSGARPLDLLIQKPASVVSIDINPCQNYLLELKMRAIEMLDYQEFLQFIGIYPSTKRARIYLSIRKFLSLEARTFWNSHLKILKKGLIYQGGWEKYFSLLAQIVRLARPRILEKLFESRTVEGQANIWKKAWDDREWRFFIRFVSSRFNWKYFFRDPGFYRFVPNNFSIPDYISERFAFAFENILFKESPYAHLLFWGQYDPEGALPLHLQEEHYSTIKANLIRIRIITQDLGDYLDTCQERFNRYSLSDFSSYTDREDYKKIWDGVIRTAEENALICERQYLVKRDIPENASTYVQRNHDLEDELQRIDNSIFFTFVIAKVIERSDE